MGLTMTDRDAVEVHIMSRVIASDGCWWWSGGKNKHGYGTCCIGRSTRAVHRLMYELRVGEIPPGMHVLHRCDNRSCCRPDHLFLGVNADNVADRNAKGRQARGERNAKSRLSLADVQTIRSRRAEGYTYSMIASEFGISDVAARKVATGRNYAHVR